MHTPFCLKKCYYCIYGSIEPGSREEIDEFYREIIPGQIRQYRPILENVPFDQAYFGGGTPTIADAETLAGIYETVPNFKTIPIKTTEASPYSLTDEHIDLFHRYGFVYVSLGVQTLSRRVLEFQNRFVVGREKLYHICRNFEKYNIICNMDLIFYLDTGELEDIAITANDLEIMMSDIRPTSMTLHFNYRVKKSFEKRKAMVDLIKKMMGKYPEYRPVNALLEDADVEYDMVNSAEYRIMRGKENFNFYMLPKIPQSHAYGHNILSIGSYRDIKPRYNYYYIFDFMDKYLLKSFYIKSKNLTLDFERIRNKLGLSHLNFTGCSGFFKEKADEEKFREIIKQTKYPYYEF